MQIASYYYTLILEYTYLKPFSGMEILHSKIVQQSRQLFITGNDHDTVNFNATILV